MNTTTRTTEKKRANGSKGKPVSWGNRIQTLLVALRPHIAYYCVLILAITAINFLIRPLAALDLSGFNLGQPSPQVVSSPFEFDFIDLLATRAKQVHAEALVSPIYTMQPDNLETMRKRIHALEEATRTVPLNDDSAKEEWVKAVLQTADFPLENRTFDITNSSQDTSPIPPTLYESLFYYRTYETLWKSLYTQITAAAGRGIAENVLPLSPARGNATPLSSVSVPVTLVAPDGSRFAAPSQEIRTTMQFFQQFKQLISTNFPEPVKDYAARELAMALVQNAYAGPTLVYNQDQTEELKKKAREEVVPVTVHVNKEETIVGKNEILTSEILQKLEQLRERMRISPSAKLSYLLLSILFVFMILRYVRINHADVASDTRKITVIFLGILLVFALTRIAVYLSLLDLGSHKLTHIAYAIPLGALGVILTLLVRSLTALYCCSLCSIYMGIILSGGPYQFVLPYVLVAYVTSCGAIYAVVRIRQRSDLYRAGGLAMLLAVVLILTLSLNEFKHFEQILLRAEELKWALIWGAVNGGLISILSMALLPIFEDFYGVVTDMKLLELSQKNEILQRLEQEAPGSYQHSMRVSTLAETAAESIGANALLTRVGCYYHDIGKIVKPQYFIENQQTSADKAKHSKLTTNMSCFLIRSHVKHGIDIAQKYKLPQVIIDFIPEHHGTTLMSFFYHQALEEQGTEGTVKESDFRYPGPKPQCKETAIAMLSDALEAASRTLETGNEREVHQLVRKIINDRFMDGQFDECNLTLKDLHQLSLTFSDSILSMLHQRIAYPSGPPRGKETEADKNPAEAPDKETEKKNPLVASEEAVRAPDRIVPPATGMKPE